MNHFVANTRVNMIKTKRDSVAFCSTGSLLSDVSPAGIPCGFMIFSAVSVELDCLVATSRRTALCQPSTFPLAPDAMA